MELGVGQSSPEPLVPIMQLAEGAHLQQRLCHEPRHVYKAIFSPSLFGLFSDFLWLLAGNNVLGNPLREFQMTTLEEGVEQSRAPVTSRSLLGRQQHHVVSDVESCKEVPGQEQMSVQQFLSARSCLSVVWPKFLPALWPKSIVLGYRYLIAVGELYFWSLTYSELA